MLDLFEKSEVTTLEGREKGRKNRLRPVSNENS